MTFYAPKTHPKTVYEVINTPSDDNIIIYSNKQRYNAGGNANATEPWMNRCPHAQRAKAHSLTHSEFNQEQWNAFQHQHHHEGYQKCAYKKVIEIQDLPCAYDSC